MPFTRHATVDPAAFAAPSGTRPAPRQSAGAGGRRQRRNAGTAEAPRIATLPRAAADHGEGNLDRLRRAIHALAPEESRDLTLRQIAALLLIHDGGAPRTACALAAELGIPRPAMTRALDRLGALDLARREPDPACRRNVLVRATAHGEAFLASLRRRMASRHADLTQKKSRTARTPLGGRPLAAANIGARGYAARPIKCNASAARVFPSP